MIDKETLFRIWAPPNRPWSGWVKPILFARWPQEVSSVEPSTTHDCSWVPPPSERLGLIVDLPGVDSVALGLQLAERGYSPIAVFLGSPPPQTPRYPWLPPPPSVAVVDVDSILGALAAGADRLGTTPIAAIAPPAFLIDHLRFTPKIQVQTGVYDNRSWIATTDFPSAERLKGEGITGILLVTATDAPLAEDLEHLLRVWNADKIPILVKSLANPAPPQPLKLKKPSWWLKLRQWWHRLFHDNLQGYGHYITGSSG